MQTAPGVEGGRLPLEGDPQHLCRRRRPRGTAWSAHLARSAGCRPTKYGERHGRDRVECGRAIALALGGGERAGNLLRHFAGPWLDRKSTRLNSSHGYISYAVFCLKKKKARQSILACINQH